MKPSIVRRLVVGFFLFVMSVGGGQAADNIVSTEVEGQFHEVSANVRAAILGKGINIAHVLPASQMLNRTGPDFG